MSFLDNTADWLNEKSFTTKIAILLGLIIIMSGIYWYFVWSPNNDKLSRLQETLDTNKKRLAELENIKRELPKFEEQFKILNNQFQIASLKLPKEEEIPALIDSIYSDISASGLEPIVFAPKGQIKKDIYAEIPLEMKVVGNYFELANFFDRISRLPRIVNVRDLKLKRNKDSTSRDVILSADFTTVTFRLLPPQEIESEMEKGKNGKRKKGKKK